MHKTSTSIEAKPKFGKLCYLIWINKKTTRNTFVSFLK